MSARQLIILAIAFVAAAGALFFIRNMGAARPAPAVAADINMPRVLVAARDIPQGAALTGADLQWRAFPPESINSTFVKEAQQPNAVTEMTGWIARRAFVAGEPVSTGALVNRDGRGFMAAQLQPGYRAVSIKIDRETAAGNYIQPNDHVDIFLITQGESAGEGGGKEVHTELVLEDVRVLAIGEHTQPQEEGQAPAQVDGGVAVLELSMPDARTLAFADELGKLSLALRGVEAEPPGLRVASATPSSGALDRRQIGSAVRIHSFGSTSTASGGR